MNTHHEGHANTCPEPEDPLRSELQALRCGTVAKQRQVRALLIQKSDLTLLELRAATGLNCSLQAINVVLGKLGLTYKTGVARLFFPDRKGV